MPIIDYEAQDVAQMRSTAELVGRIDGLPAGLASAIASTLTAAADELDAGRRLPREIRRAVRHVVTAVDDVLAGRD